MKPSVAWALSALATTACGREHDTAPAPDPALQALAELSPTTLPAPPPDLSNRYADNAAAAAFGQQLFFDPGFSGALLDTDNNGSSATLGVFGENGKVACAGCHIPTPGFIDTRSTRETVSLAAGWGQRKTKMLLDVAQGNVMMWDGRHDALYNQPFGALENAVEMNSSRLYAAEQIYKRYRPIYEAIFGPIPIALDQSPFAQLTGATTGCQQLQLSQFGAGTGVDCHGMPGDKAEFDQLSADDQDAVTRVWVNVGKAITAYERKLTCGPSRFDQWMHGAPDSLTPLEQRGARLFVGEHADGHMTTGCNGCHSGPFLSDQSFHNVGLAPSGVGPSGAFFDIGDHGALAGLTAALADPLNVRGQFSDGDDGRLPATIPLASDGAFRTPSLRCVAKRPTFMHTGQIISLADAVLFFDQGGDSGGFPGTNEIVPANYSDDERAALVAFLKALDGPGPDDALLEPPDLPP